MKILHICYAYDASSASARLALEQEQCGHDVYIYSQHGLLSASEKPGRLLTFRRLKAVALNRLDRLVTKLLIKRRSPGFFSASLTPARLPKAVKAAYWDSIHVHWIASNFCSLREIRQLRGVKFVHFHDFWLLNGIAPFDYYNGSLNALGRWISPMLSRYRSLLLEEITPTLVAPSTRACEQLISTYGRSRDEILVVPNKIGALFSSKNALSNQSRDSEFGDNRLVFLHVVTGNDPEFKGSSTIISALQLLSPEVAERCKIRQVGSPIKICYAINNVVVELLPPVPPDKMPAAYRQCDFTIIWSVFETFSQVAVESLLSERPILTHADLSCARFCASPPSLVAPDRSPHALARLITAAVLYPPCSPGPLYLEELSDTLYPDSSSPRESPVL